MRSISTVALAFLCLPFAAPAFGQNAEGMSTEEIVRVLQPAAAEPRTRGLRVADCTRGLALAVTCGGDRERDRAGPPVEVIPAGGPQSIWVNILFDLDSAALSPSEAPKLTNVCEAMKQVETPVIRVVGHTDATGSSDYNRRLSRLRAEEVRRHLVSRCGIAPGRLVAEGSGESALLPDAEPSSGLNRRVEFVAGI